jgi:diguanylate cyclase
MSLAVMAAFLIPAAWVLAWMILEVLFASLRWLSLVRYREQDASGMPGDAKLPVVWGLGWATIASAAFALCALSDDTSMIVLTAVAVTSFVSGAATRNAGTPRYAAFLILLFATPFAVSLLFTTLPYAHLVAGAIIAGTLGSIAILWENHRSLAEMFFTQFENDRLAHTDPLTGLANRATFWKHLTSTTARSPTAKRCLQVLYLDLDDFKPVNDQHGHAAGDMVLCQVATRLSESVRLSDLVARIGGDEFVVSLPDASPSEAAKIADRIVERVAQPYEIGTVSRVEIGVSVGIASFQPEQGDTPESLLLKADAALYLAKRKGGNRFCLAEDNDLVEATLVPQADHGAMLARSM